LQTGVGSAGSRRRLSCATDRDRGRRALASNLHCRRCVRGTAALVFAAVVGCGYNGASSDQPDASSPSPTDGAPPDAEGPDGELRGVWITRFAYSSQAGLEAIIDRAAAANFNAVFVQIRGEGDAYYHSNVEPWSQRLSGVLGRDPGWDPLQVAIDRAHLHGMELHAYFNVFSAWNATAALPEAEGAHQHALYLHPDWLAVDSTGTNRDSEYKWFSPANPAVRAHIAAVARDLLEQYDVDGFHLDRIRVPGADYSRDEAANAGYAAASAEQPGLTWADYMRSQVDQMVADLYAVVGSARPAVRMSASVWGIYQRLPGCTTSQGYDGYYQDSLGWLEAGTIDALVPMMYWPIEAGSCTDWATLLDGFMARRAGRHIWAGMHALDDSAWDFSAVRARIDYARTAAAQGTVVFASTYLDADVSRWTDYLGTAAAPGPFFDPAPPPRMSWK
jgi:uncharacterized lipoprotein YddW (UPF0748 family)